MGKVIKARKAIISEEIQVRLEGDNTYYTAKTKKEAEKLVKKLEKRDLKRFKNENDSERIRLENLMKLEENINKYIRHLTKQLWYDVRHSKDTDATLLKKQIRDELKDLADNKKQVTWKQDYTSDKDYYVLEKVEQ